MKRIFIILLLSHATLPLFAQKTPFECSKDKNTTATYAEILSYYEQLDRKYEQLKIFTYGPTDIGKPLRLVVLSKSKLFDPIQIRKRNKCILLINNGIHPGEPESIDASMMLCRDLLEKKLLPDSVVICIIPVFNIGGCYNRGTSRANQNGPKTYGFAGNYQNLDLNADFIKTDSKNSFSFQQLFNLWQPDVLIDHHNGNGADHQYVITLGETQRDKLNPLLAEFMVNKMEPALYYQMHQNGFEMAPLIKYDGKIPDTGIMSLLETPRSTTGYAALHNTISFITETHKLKPFQKRVEASYQFMKNLIAIMQKQSASLLKVKAQANQQTCDQKKFALNWEIDKKKFETLLYKGYEAKYMKSEVSGVNRLFYDRNDPFARNIKWHNTYYPTAFAEKPVAYIIPQSWQKVIDLLKLNQVKMRRLKKDEAIDVSMYYILNYKTTPRPVEGHYMHSDVTLRVTHQKVQFYQGDYVVYVNQTKNRYIVETLEPQGVDSFFAWNFFDSILDRKEYFSTYLFEVDAGRLLHDNPGFRAQLDKEVRRHPEMAKNSSAQLDWIYRNTDYSEKAYLRYPVGKLHTNAKFELY